MSTFLTIPAELRVMIYNHLLISSEPIIILGEEAKLHSFVTHPRGRTLPPFIALPPSVPSGAIIRTCRAVYMESLEILYSKNTFQFPERLDVGSGRSIAHMDRFLERIGPNCANLMRHIRIPVPNCFIAHKEYARCVEQLQKTCANLQGIELCFSDEHYRRAVAHRMGVIPGEEHMRTLEMFASDLNGLSKKTALLTFSFPVREEKLEAETLGLVILCACRRLQKAAPGCVAQAVPYMKPVLLGRWVQAAMGGSAHSRHVEYQHLAWRKERQREDELSERGWSKLA